LIACRIRDESDSARPEAFEASARRWEPVMRRRMIGIFAPHEAPASIRS
jgi:hypothetical protein